MSSGEENVNILCAAVQHNFRRTLLLTSREENINSLGAAVQHDFRRTLLVPSREENIKRISIAWAPRHDRRKWGDGGMRPRSRKIGGGRPPDMKVGLEAYESVPPNKTSWRRPCAAVQPGPQPGQNPRGCKIIYNEVHKPGQPRWRAPTGCGRYLRTNGDTEQKSPFCTIILTYWNETIHRYSTNPLVSVYSMKPPSASTVTPM